MTSSCNLEFIKFSNKCMHELAKLINICYNDVYSTDSFIKSLLTFLMAKNIYSKEKILRYENGVLWAEICKQYYFCYCLPSHQQPFEMCKASGG